MIRKEERLPATASQTEIDLFMQTVARSSACALLLDYDGTLSPFSLERAQALPYPGVTSLLQRIVETGHTRLVIISGRDAYEVGPLLGVHPAPEVWGSHGLQRLRPDGTYEMPRASEAVLQALGDAEDWLRYQGLHKRAESKPGSIAVHWRGVHESRATELRGRILLGWLPIAERGFSSVLEFDGGVEMRMHDLDKGDAVQTILQEIGPDDPVAYLGDDTTDERAFRALQHRGLAVLMRSEWRKTAAKLWLRPPEDLVGFLEQWLLACGEAVRRVVTRDSGEMRQQ